jgi:putative (di)nucleoside polyphosphate hydrolase
VTARRVSCGVVITDGARLVLGHATGSPRWDIPKGLAEPGETLLDAALRELREETGLIGPASLAALGVHAYLPGKDLALFLWCPDPLPDPASLRCTAMVERPGRTPFPELDRFGVFTFEAGLALVGSNLARVLTAIRPNIRFAKDDCPLPGPGQRPGL